MRKIYRHESNKGSVIEFDMYGKAMKMFVPDVAYRPVNRVAWGLWNQDVPEIQHFSDDFKPILKDAYLQTRFPSFRTDKTAKENTDILMKYDTPAAHACCEIDVGLGPMDLPNIYELMIIFQESDRLDALDPTLLQKDLKFNVSESYAVWSSTSYSETCARRVDYLGNVERGIRHNTCGVIPVLEL